MLNKLKENNMKYITLTQDEIRTLQFAIHCARGKLSKQKAEKTTQEWIQSNGEHSESHNNHMKNLWSIEEDIHGRKK
jgi:hypothetical protein